MPENIVLSAEIKNQPKDVWQRVSSDAKFLLLGMPNISDNDIIKAEKILDDEEFKVRIKKEWGRQAEQFGDSNPERQEKNWAKLLKDELIKTINS
jgi:hypothetical protein